MICDFARMDVPKNVNKHCDSTKDRSQNPSNSKYEKCRKLRENKGTRIMRVKL